jgi:pyruvate/2-oxoglutarate dehydrogenase complex dihydrolipoamide dehydrogenase (E3) component
LSRTPVDFLVLHSFLVLYLDQGLELPGTPFIAVDEQMRTSCDRVFAIGDVNELCLLDSAAVAEARVAVDTILGRQARFSAR